MKLHTVTFHQFDGMEWVQQHDYTVTTPSNVFVCDRYRTYTVSKSNFSNVGGNVHFVERGSVPVELGYVCYNGAEDYCRVIHMDDEPVFVDTYCYVADSKSIVVAHRISCDNTPRITKKSLILNTSIISPNPLDLGLGHVCLGADIAKDSDIIESNGVPMKAYSAMGKKTKKKYTNHMRSGAINGQIYSMCKTRDISVHMRDIRVEDAICIYTEERGQGDMPHNRGFLASGALIASYWESIELRDIRYLSSVHVLSSNPFRTRNNPSGWAET